MTMMCIPGRPYVLPKFLEGCELLLMDFYDEEINKWLALRERRAEDDEDDEKGDVEEEKE